MRVVETNSPIACQHWQGSPIDQDDLSEVVCRKCGSELDKYTRKIAEAEDLKRELVGKLSATTLRHRNILKWSGKKAEHAPASPSPGFRVLHHKRSKSDGSPRTQASAQKPPAKHPRSSISAAVPEVFATPGPWRRKMRQAYNNVILVYTHRF